MSKVKVVMIGINGFGSYISGILSQCSNIELVGVYDIDAAAVEKKAKSLMVEPYYTLEDALSAPCDAVILEVPNSVHAEIVRSAAKAKKHVFVEKPITNSIGDGEDIIRVCQEEGVLLQVGHSTRFMGVYRRVKELIDQNAIGNLVMIEANYSSPRAKRHTKDAWRYSRETCPGGPMIQLGIHSIDTIFYLTGCKPLEISGMFTDGFTETDNEDAGVIIMKMEKDILAYVGSSYVSPLTESMVIYGDNGRIDVRNNTVRLNHGGRDDIIYMEEESGDTCYIKQFESFADCILRGTTPEVDGAVGLQNLQVVLTALKIH